ncbi:hypothetical protein CsSME_00008169 [Camellia sinensis var. sinensis]
MFGKLSNLENLNLIPIELRERLKLLSLNLSNNRIGKNIPLEIGNLQGLQRLDLGCNSLTDVSFNQFEGPIPNMKGFREAPFEGFRGNKGLSGNATGLKTCSPKMNNENGKKKTNKVGLRVVHIFRFLLLLLMVLGIFMAFHKKVRNTTNEPRQVHNQNLFAIWSYDGKMVYENIIEAIGNFSTKHCVGEGGCGTVYRVDLPSGQVVAVKKLHESPDNLKSFTSEIHALIEIRHENIVKRYGYCSHPRHLFLVYEFLEEGILGNILSTTDQALQFDWIKRVNVVKELAYTIEVNERCDVYSFGVLTLELITRKHLGDLISSLSLSSSFSLSTSTVHRILLKDVLDQRLLPPKNQVAQQVVMAAKLAFACLQANPLSRPTMRQVAMKLSDDHVTMKISDDQSPPLQNQFHMITLGHLF